MNKPKDPCDTCPIQAGMCDIENDPCLQKLKYMQSLIDESMERTHDILIIRRRRSFEQAEDDDSKVELNEGYEFETDAPIPEIADGLAKMAIEMDKMEELGENGGLGFITLITEFYNKLKNE